MDLVAKRSKNIEAVLFIVLFLGLFGFLASHMGIKNLMNTGMATAHVLLKETVLYLMGVMVLAGAFGKLLVEFGVVGLLEFIFAPLMKPIFGLPGVASLAGVMTFLSDNPAIISLSHDKDFRGYFKPYQLISLTNFGTAFGMGLIVIAFMGAQSVLDTSSGVEISFFSSAIIGFFGAVIGAMVSTRLMQKLIQPDLADIDRIMKPKNGDAFEDEPIDENKSTFIRFMDAILDGGKSGVQMGLEIIPGVLIICTVVMMLTFDDTADNIAGYSGAAFEGVPVLGMLGEKLMPVFNFLFGFESPELVAFPITSLGAVGAAMSLVPRFIEQGIIGGNEIAVFTAMGMCWSGYLSTHTAMLDTLGFRKLTSKAILAHTLGGLVAGVSAHLIFLLFSCL